MNFIKENYLRINERIDTACIRSGRDPKTAQLVVVTKNQPVELVQQVLEAGARRLGENYPEETVEKIKLLHGNIIPEWHMIGHIQSRKIKYLVSNFDIIHSVDNYDIALKISNAMGKSNRTIPILLEVNISGEESKWGYDVRTSEKLDELLKDIEKMRALSNIHLAGLMTMPPMVEEIESNRIVFRKCSELLFSIQNQFHIEDFQFLSMGTSQDFEVAIEEGATHVRIGEAIMGKRQQKW